MNKSLIGKLLRAGIAATLVFATTSTVLAVPPYKESFNFDYTGFIIGDCGSFLILNDAVAEGFYIEHFDTAGNTTHVNQHIKYSQSIYYNSENTAVSLYGGPAELENDRFDFTGDQAVLAVSGVLFKITVPGHGVIFHEAGRTIFDYLTGDLLWQAGPNDFTEENVAALCAALTP